MDDEAQHELRIRMKKLRYGIEFFASLFPGRKQQRRSAQALEALKRATDSLGELHDIAIRRATSPRPGTGRPDFLAGLIAGYQSARVKPLKAEALSAFADFTSVKPFWT
jgi:hypothetical protein